MPITEQHAKQFIGKQVIITLDKQGFPGNIVKQGKVNAVFPNDLILRKERRLKAHHLIEIVTITERKIQT